MKHVIKLLGPCLVAGPSSLFPWAGQVVFRSGYDADATWAFFDIGPYGSSGMRCSLSSLA